MKLDKVSTQNLYDELLRRHGKYNSHFDSLKEYQQKGEEDFMCWLKFVEGVENA